MPPVGLTVEIRGDTSKLDSALDSSKGKVGGFGDVIGRNALPIATAVAGVGTLAVGVVNLTQAAADDAREQEKLEATIRAAGAATAESNAQVDAAIKAGQERAFTDSETRAGLESLIVATGDVGEATDLLTEAQDIARFAGVDLTTAADALAKAHAGNDGALRKLIPGLEKGATATDTIAAASTAAAGQADIYADSAAGMGDRVSDAFGEIGESIGAEFLPILEEVMPELMPLLEAFAELIHALLPILIPLIKSLAWSLKGIAKGLTDVVTDITNFVNWIRNAIDAVGDFLEAANPLAGIHFPELPFGIGSSATGTAARSGRSGGGSAPVTINISGAIDPEGVARSVARILTQHSIRMGHSSGLVTGAAR